MENSASIETSKQSNRILSVNLSSFTAVSPKESEDNKGIVKYGDRNLFPQYLEELAIASPVHGGIVGAKGQMFAGKGFTTDNAVVNVALKSLKLDKSLQKIAKDYARHGGYFLEIIYSLDMKRIAEVNHLPYTDCRFKVDTDSGEPCGIMYSRDWSKAIASNKRFKPCFIPKFDFSKRNEEHTQVIWTMGDISSNEYYSKPDYISALNYIELDKEIGIYHVNNIINGFFPSHIAQFYGSTPELDEQMAIKRNYESKLGAKEAGGVFMIFSENKDLNTEITPFPLTDADKQYQFLSDESTKKIMIAHRVTSPLLFGIRDGSGLGSNKDEIVTSWELFKNQVIEPAQRMICEPIEEIFAELGQVATITIIPNTPMAMLEAVIQTQPQTQAQVKQSTEPQGADILIQLGEDEIDMNGYILVDAFKVDEEDDAHTMEVQQATTGTARPNAGSEQDKTINGDLFITRYRYRGSANPERPFCQKMIGSNKLYRKEDIVAMENKQVNDSYTNGEGRVIGWGPNGDLTYSIWQYKGGGNCNHFWQKEVYMSIEGAGIDVNNPNARQMAVAKAEKLGYKVRNAKEVAQLPIDMPYNGFLSTNPIFGA